MDGPITDHGAILNWALRHDATPAQSRIFVFDSEPGKLHFLFRETRTGTPEFKPIAWEAFFALFDLLGLALMYTNEPDFEIVKLEKPSIYRTVNVHGM